MKSSKNSAITTKRASSKNEPRAKQQIKVSDMLENETKKMEEKLNLVKKMMELEKNKGLASNPRQTTRRSAGNRSNGENNLDNRVEKAGKI